MNFVAKLPALAAGLALLSIIYSPTSKAADLPVVEEPIVYDWTGCYIGANAGFGWGRSEWSDEVVGEFSSDKPDGWLAGRQLGCNLHIGPSWPSTSIYA